MCCASTQLGAFAQSEALLGREIRTARSALGADDPVTLSLQSELVGLYSAKFEPAAADALARWVLARQRDLRGPDSLEAAEAESGLAAILDMQGH